MILQKITNLIYKTKYKVYRNKIQTALHPTVVYYKVNNILKLDSICFISDDLMHNVDMVYRGMKLTIKHIKSNIS